MTSFTSQLMIDEIGKRGWKAEMLDDKSSAVIVLTLPNGKTHYLLSCLTDNSSAVGFAINQNKLATYKVAERLKIPVPAYQMYDPAEPQKARDFLLTQRAIGNELVIKPIDRDRGEGVVVGVTSKQSLDAAIQHAMTFSNKIILQQRFIGEDCRLAVVDGACVAVAHRSPPIVVGDGIHTVNELLSRMNDDPRRSHEAHAQLRPINSNDVRRFIGGEKMTEVPALGAEVPLLGTANLSKGGEAEDITDEIHPSYGEAAVRLATELGLGVCGVDLLCRNPLQPLSANNAALLEINCAIGLRLHHMPTKGKPRNVAGAILDAFAKKNRI